MKTQMIIGILILGTITSSLALEIIVRRDRKIIIDEFSVRDMPLDQVLVKLEDASVQADEQKVGIRIVNLTEEPLRYSRVTINVRNRSVRSIVDLLTNPLNLWITSNGDTIEVRKSERVTKGAQQPHSPYAKPGAAE